MTLHPSIGVIHAVLSDCDVQYWMDSGSLLGLIRDGKEIPWDSDIDLGVWAGDLERLAAALPEFRRRGYEVSQRRYRGRVYGLTIRNRAERESWPVHIHVFFAAGEIAWSPQTVTYQPVRRVDGEQPFAPWPRLRSALTHIKAEARERRTGSGLRRLWRWGVCLPVWGALAVARDRLDRQYWERVWPYSTVHAIHTWVVPSRHFDRLEHRQVDDVPIPVPSDVEDYLALRYGEWRTPVADWCYWTDDGCLYADTPERVLSQLGLGEWDGRDG